MNLKIAILFLFIGSYTMYSQNWNTNFDDAKNLALKENKNIILVFQGSDWCAPCIKLDREIWSTPEFIKYSKQHFIMFKADFPRKSKNRLTEKQQIQNKRLMEKYNKPGYFPYVVVLNKKGEVLGNTGYKKTTPSEYIKILISF
ncbi:thioredoxin-related protein [Lutibacter oceani]|uniref:Thioredoxin-related protein n=1 Tax=Lutibacter oceani TaxID=1853311 RepID=A0A3D9RR12_9FLAO|nr:thioredoxin family protein [Lutibacter oceani]REE81918.1 thioredoxin-related protein [Lutibacter oceani]